MLDAIGILKALRENENDNTIFNPRGVNIVPEIEAAIEEVEYLKTRSCSRCGKKERIIT